MTGEACTTREGRGHIVCPTLWFPI